MLHCHFSIDTVDTISIATEEQLRSDKSHCLCCKCLWLLHFPYCFSCSSTDNGIFLHVMKAGRTFQQIKEKFIQNLKIFRWSICLKLILQRKYLESREERNLKKKSHIVISHCRAWDVKSFHFLTSTEKELLRPSGRRFKSHPERELQHWSQNKEKKSQFLNMLSGLIFHFGNALLHYYWMMEKEITKRLFDGHVLSFFSIL